MSSSTSLSSLAAMHLEKTQPNSLAASLKSKASLGTAEQKKAAKEFESMVMSQMLQPMFSGLQTDGMFGGGKGEEMFRSLLVDQYGKQISQRGGLGIAESVMATMLKLQEAASGDQPMAAEAVATPAAEDI